MLALVLGGLIAGGGQAPAEAADPRPSVIVSVNGVDVYPAGPSESRPQTFAATLEAATLTGGVAVYWGPRGDEKLHSIIVGASKEFPLHRGIMTAVNTSAARTEEHDVSGDLGMSGGEIDVMDLAATPDGTVTRFDIVLSTPGGGGRFGEIRMGVPETSSLSATATQLQWPLLGREAPTFPVIDMFRNVTDEPLTLGKTRVHGGASRDYIIGADHCSRAVLAPGGECTITVRFKPRQGGPRVSDLELPTSEETLRVPLSGNAPLGRSKVTIKGHNPMMSEPIAGPYSPLTTIAFGGNHHSEPSTNYFFTMDETGRQARSNPVWERMQLNILSETGRPRKGTWTVNESNSSYGFDLTARNDRCAEMYGTMTVHRFSVDTHDQSTYADVDFDQRCRYGPTTSKLKAHLGFQVRTDTSAPARPSRLEVRGRSVTWKKSGARDLQTTIVRLHPGNGASPAGGLLLKVGGGQSATLPPLPQGTTWTISAFSVDKTGNVSKPRQLAFDV